MSSFSLSHEEIDLDLMGHDHIVVGHFEGLPVCAWKEFEVEVVY